MIDLPTVFYTMKLNTRCLSARNMDTPSEAYLRDRHTIPAKARKAIVEEYNSYTLLDPKDISLPPPFRPPFEAIAAPIEAFLCDEDECSFISKNHKVIAQHCNKDYGWKSTKERS